MIDPRTAGLSRVYIVLLGTPTEPEMLLGAFSKREYASMAVNSYMMDPEVPKSKEGFSIVTIPVDQGITAEMRARK